MVWSRWPIGYSDAEKKLDESYRKTSTLCFLIWVLILVIFVFLIWLLVKGSKGKKNSNLKLPFYQVENKQ